MNLKDCYNFDDFREIAKKKLPAPIFHYIDGGSDDEVTLKRFVQENGKIKLVAENKNYNDILIDQNTGFSLEGIAVGVVREDVF